MRSSYGVAKKVYFKSQNAIKEMTKILKIRQSSKGVCMEGFSYASGVKTKIHKNQTVRTFIITIQDVVKNIIRAVLHLL